ncbi:hypothetical protein Trydic_g17227 [Trypoxylus dichotomus]
MLNLLEENEKLRQLTVNITWDVPLSHTIETRISSCATKQQEEQFRSLGIKFKNGYFTKKEDEQIKKNFKQFCMEHGLKYDAKPFLRFLYGQEPILKKVERLKFARYLGRGLPYRRLFGIYSRFKILYSALNKGRFTPEEDAVILKYMELLKFSNNQFAELSKILNRPRPSIEKRYRLLCESRRTLEPSDNIDCVKYLSKVTGSDILQNTECENGNSANDLIDTNHSNEQNAIVVYNDIKYEAEEKQTEISIEVDETFTDLKSVIELSEDSNQDLNQRNQQENMDTTTSSKKRRKQKQESKGEIKKSKDTAVGHINKALAKKRENDQKLRSKRCRSSTIPTRKYSIGSDDISNVKTGDNSENHENKRKGLEVTSYANSTVSTILDKNEKLKKLRVNITWDVPLSHIIETRVSSRPTKKEKLLFRCLDITFKDGPFTINEDEKIRTNFRKFCMEHELEYDAEPFLRFQYAQDLVIKKRERIKFAIYLAKGLANRTLYSVYSRFAILYSSVNNERFTSKCSDHGVSELSKTLNRPRSHVKKQLGTLREKPRRISEPNTCVDFHENECKTKFKESCTDQNKEYITDSDCASDFETNDDSENEESKRKILEMISQADSRMLDILEKNEKLKLLYINITWDVPLSHTIETRISSCPTKQQQQQFVSLGIKFTDGHFSKKEDETIKKNFKQFCMEHELEHDPTPFMCLRYGQASILSDKERLKFGRYLEEDAVIMKFVKITQDNHKRFSTLSKVLNRPRYLIEKRFRLLRRQFGLLKPRDYPRLVKCLIEVTNSNSLEELRDKRISNEKWLKVAEKLHLCKNHIKVCWIASLYTKLFNEGPIDVDKIIRKLIAKLDKRKVVDYKELNWTELAKSFRYMTNAFLYRLFKKTTIRVVPQHLHSNLRECVLYLKKVYEKDEKVMQPIDNIILEI